jgi:hypothetical protein
VAENTWFWYSGNPSSCISCMTNHAGLRVSMAADTGTPSLSSSNSAAPTHDKGSSQVQNSRILHSSCYTMSTVAMSTLGSILELLYSARWSIDSALATLYFTSLFRAYWRLSHIKGPWLAQFSDPWLLGAIYRQQDHLEFYDLTKKYGLSQRMMKVETMPVH